MPDDPAQLTRVKSDIAESAQNGKLIVICGAGTSLGLECDPPAKNWLELIQNGLLYATERELITKAQFKLYGEILRSGDIDDALTSAEFLTRKFDRSSLDHKAIWLRQNFERLNPKKNNMFNEIRRISDTPIPIATTNFDLLLEDVTGKPSASIDSPPDVMRWLSGKSSSILHLHGRWDVPDTCVLGLQDYNAVLQEEGRRFLQTVMSTQYKILFIGCGETFSDPNFSSLISWVRSNLISSSPIHYSLVLNRDFDAKRVDDTWAGFVQPVPVGNDYLDIPKFLKGLELDAGKLIGGAQQRTISADAERVLRAYKSFLIEDCGQMTVEGVRADLDTSQRKFDLEKLFVPLTATPLPPANLTGEKEGELQQWKDDNPSRQEFGAVFEKHRRLVLLALPGGGKTLLSKRVAVAYASDHRLNLVDDNLPDLPLTPVLIRCREWKDRIRQPIAEIIRQIPEFYGERDIGDLFSALLPELDQGNVVLIIDGLDEIHDDAARTTFVENVERFLLKFEKTRVLITSREAGFDLVAPCLVRFCERWRVDPLSDEAISLLSNHWHTLMLGNRPEATAEAEQVAENILGQSALRKLAENPLLLTMLLVVKHGNGRLPPDKVALYERAVEILLDTWNIKGHAPLNAKEAVPQLAFLAFDLHSSGKQTATVDEAVKILERGREEVPLLRRYAKDEPSRFIKRVELRSSLLIEAGHRLENARPTPFYQFRHLTFQEYLAAVAVADGHVGKRLEAKDPLGLLEHHLMSPEWKEVVPMAVALSKRQGEPLLRKLAELSALELEEFLEDEKRLRGGGDQMPRATSILAECVVSEAEVPQDLVDEVLRRIAFFSCGGQTDHDWVSLARGPYGPDLLRQAEALASDLLNINYGWFRNTLAVLEAYKRFEPPIDIVKIRKQFFIDMRSSDESVKLKAILSIPGAIWRQRTEIGLLADGEVNDALGRAVLLDSDALSFAAMWAWAFQRKRHMPTPSSPPELYSAIFEKLKSKTLERSKFVEKIAAFAMCSLAPLKSNPAIFRISEDEINGFVEILSSDSQDGDEKYEDIYDRSAALVSIHLSNDGSRSDLIREHLKAFRPNYAVREVLSSLATHYDDL